MKWMPIAVAAAILGGCVAPEEEGARSDARSEALPEPLPKLAEIRDNPRLSLLDHALVHYFEGAAPDGPVVCAAAHDGRSAEALDIADETALMERHPTLAPMVRCTLQNGAWTDEDSGEEAVLLSLHSFTCASPDSCSGWISPQRGATGGMSELYRMEWGAKGWSFTRDPRLIADQ